MFVIQILDLQLQVLNLSAQVYKILQITRNHRLYYLFGINIKLQSNVKQKQFENHTNNLDSLTNNH